MADETRTRAACGPADGPSALLRICEWKSRRLSERRRLACRTAGGLAGTFTRDCWSASHDWLDTAIA